MIVFGLTNGGFLQHWHTVLIFTVLVSPVLDDVNVFLMMVYGIRVT